MIEFTTLELTLTCLCGGLFVYGMKQQTTARSAKYLIEAMCHDKELYDRICEAMQRINKGTT